MPSAPNAGVDYPAETRFAVVMYGGVSLAIYINGVAQELLHMVRATARNDGSLGPKILNPDLTRTERVYRKVSHLVGGARLETVNELLEKNAEIPTRFIIDIIAGTSAGGINGIFLAKALANGESISSLQKLWVEEGDLACLINDKQSVEKPLTLKQPPASLLNSQRMYLKLLQAFDGMESNGAGTAGGSAQVDELDLFVTTTDMQGIALPIRLADEIVYERRYRNVLHFVYKGGRNDLTKEYNPFLAYAARCTSAFPFAFEPMCLCDTDDVLRHLRGYAGNSSCRSDSQVWQRFYQDYLNPQGSPAVPFPHRSFGDGGYLDNKPFSHAIDTLGRRHATVPVDRKLLYVEPSPEHPEDSLETERKPDALENAYAALVSLPRYETIREDLGRVRTRNRLIQRINRIISGFERDMDQVEQQRERKVNTGAFYLQRDTGELWSKSHLTDKEWSQLDLADMVKRKGRSYIGYHRLEIGSVADDLARILVRVSGLDEESDYLRLARTLLRAWRDKHYVEYRQDPADETMNSFLHSFGLAYAMRRLGFLRNRIDRLYALDEEARQVIKFRVKEAWADDRDTHHKFRVELRRIKGELNRLHESLSQLEDSLASIGRPDPQAAAPGMPVSPVYAQIQDLVGVIANAIPKKTPVSTQPQPTRGRLILDYFLGVQGKPGENPGQTDAERIQEECDGRAREFFKTNKAVEDAFTKLGNLIAQQIRPAIENADGQCRQILSTPSDSSLPAGTRAARTCLFHYYQHYDDYDMIIFPIVYGTNIGEAHEAEIVRVSPEDGRALIKERESGCHKLAGTALGHFGAFVERRWRRSDILWGRLDGAERIIRVLLGDHPAARALIGEAQAAIVWETIEHLGDDEMKDLLVEACMRPKYGKPDPDTLGAFITALKANAGNPQLRQKLDERIKEGEIRDYYLKVFEDHSRPEPEPTLRMAARATTVVGDMLSGMAGPGNWKSKYTAWIARIGRIFWGLVEVAVPQSLGNLLFRYWLDLILMLGVLTLIGGLVLANSEVQRFAITALVILLAVRITVGLLQDYMQGRNGRLKLLKGAAVGLFVALMLLGTFSVLGAMGAFERFWSALLWVRAHVVHP